MGSNPRRVRKAIKKAKRYASKYFGANFRPKIRKGSINITRTTRRGGKVRSVITLDKSQFVRDARGKTNTRKVAKVAQHEFFHAMHDSLMLTKAGKTQEIISEAIAIISNAEFELARDSSAYYRYVTHLKRNLIDKPPQDKNHFHGLRIAINILLQFPIKENRKDFIRKLIEENAQKIAKIKPGDNVTINELGQIVTE